MSLRLDQQKNQATSGAVLPSQAAFEGPAQTLSADGTPGRSGNPARPQGWPVAGSASDPLGNNTKFVDTFSYEREMQDFEIAVEKASSVRRKTWALQSFVCRLAGSPLHTWPESQNRVLKCQKSLTYGAKGVDVVSSAYSDKTCFKGVMSCGQVWTCPVCTQNISRLRAEEANKLLAFSREHNYTAVLLTLTARHGRKDNLEDLVSALVEAKRTFFATYRWKKITEKLKRKKVVVPPIVGFLVAFEITWSDTNGWHPHFHLLVIVRTSTPNQAKKVLSPLRRPWLESLQSQNLSASGEHGFNIKTTEIGEYVAKFGAGIGVDVEQRKGKKDQRNLAAELTSSHTKTSSKGLTPWQILEQYASERPLFPQHPTLTQARAGALFAEYAHAFAGRQQLQWSRGLKELIGLSIVSDDEAADEAAALEAIVIRLRIHPSDWYVICMKTSRLERHDFLVEAQKSVSNEYLWGLLAEMRGAELRRDADNERLIEERHLSRSTENAARFGDV
jgi:hypothetical protein